MGRLDYATKIKRVEDEITKLEKQQEVIKEKIANKKKELEELNNSQVLAEFKMAKISIEDLKELLKENTGVE